MLRLHEISDEIEVFVIFADKAYLGISTWLRHPAISTPESKDICHRLRPFDKEVPIHLAISFTPLKETPGQSKRARFLN
jgi:hypothetical protein